MTNDTKQEIIHFWFVETDSALWFQKNEDFDALIRQRFLSIHDQAKDGLYDPWGDDAQGALALCIVLDQFSRNMFRGTSKAFETDSKALSIAKQAVNKGLDQALTPEQKTFLYLPFEHSENLEDQKRSVKLFEGMKEIQPVTYDYALQHLKVIEKFGRFPHRNAALGRKNTPEEDQYLEQPGSGF